MPAYRQTWAKRDWLSTGNRFAALKDSDGQEQENDSYSGPLQVLEAPRFWEEFITGVNPLLEAPERSPDGQQDRADCWNAKEQTALSAADCESLRQALQRRSACADNCQIPTNRIRFTGLDGAVGMRRRMAPHPGAASCASEFPRSILGACGLKEKEL